MDRRITSSSFRLNPVCALVCCMLATGSPIAGAKEFTTDNGWTGVWNTKISASSGWRTEEQDRSLIGASDAAIVKGYAATAGTNAAGKTAALAAGYRGASNSDVGNLNYNKGDRYSTLFKAMSDLTLTQGSMGFKISAKAWHDDTLANGSVPFGNQANGFNGASSTPNPMAANGVATLTTLGAPQPLSDSNFSRLNRFSGIDLRDLHFFNRAEWDGKSIDYKIGQQVVRWGNTMFIQGLSQVSPLDLTALRKPGSEAEEVLLPILAATAKVQLTKGFSLSGFYQFRHRSNNVESCGTMFGVADFGYGSNGSFCGVAQVANGTTGGWAGGVTDARPDVMLTSGKKPNNGDFGVSANAMMEGVGLVGAYAMNLTSRSPYLSGQVQPGTGAPSASTAGSRMLAQWDYADNIKLFGLTLNTRLADWQVGAEVSHSPNYPVQINGNSLVQSGLTYATLGPSAALGSLGPIGQSVQAFGAGTDWHYLQGFDRVSRTQFVINTVAPISKPVASVVGANGGRFVAEIGYQHSAVAEASMDASGNLQSMLYGRGFIFGLPVTAANCVATGATGTNPQPQGCAVDGFATKNSWGYRARVNLNYLSVAGSQWNMTPGLMFAHDVKGYSIDGQFNQGRKTLTLSLGVQYGKDHEGLLAYTRYANSASYDVLRDRDNVIAAYRYKF